MKCLYLIIASDNLDHIRDEHSQRKTWAKAIENVIWLRGGKQEKFDSINRTLYVDVDETYENILRKTIEGIRWCFENLEFDFLIRSNVSTYFVPERIEGMLSHESPANSFLGGYMEFINDRTISDLNRVFVNGAAIFLSRKTVERLVTMNPALWEGKPDDYAISQYLLSKKVEPKWISRGNIGATSILCNRSFYRLKSSENPVMAEIRMYNLHSIFSSLKTLELFKATTKYYWDEVKNARVNHRSIKRYCASVYSIFVSKIKYRELVNTGEIDSE
jgi:hypothetical protein